MSESVDTEKLFTGRDGRLFLVISLCWLTLQMGKQLFSPLLPNIIRDLSITSTEAGIGLSMMWGLYALCQYPSGRLSDRLSRKTVIVAGLTLTGVSLLVFQVTTTYSVLLVGMAIMGLGNGLFPTAARALLSDFFVERRGQAFGIHTALGDGGNAAAGAIAAVALAVATWQTAFLPVLVLLVVILLLFQLWSRESYVLKPVDLEVRSTGSKLLGNRRLRLLIVAYALFAFTWQSITGFLPTFLQIEKGFGVGLASAGFGVLFVVGAFAKLTSGVLGDRFGRVVVAVGAMGVGIVGLVGIIVSTTPSLIFVSVSVFAVGLMGFPPVMQAFLMDIFPDGQKGGDFGAFRTGYVMLGSLGPTYVGVVADVRSYSLAFVGLVACMILSAGIIAREELSG